MKKWMIGLLVALLVVSNFNVVVTSALDSKGTDLEWELVFSDEFDGSEINMDNWSFDRPDNGRWNGEIQSYTDQNAWVEDGKLIIEAREEKFTEPDGQTYDYTSSKLITQGKQIWTYGKVEVRAKMPTGQGMWPAIWMMPEDEPYYGTWPVGGEIDIMELLGHEPDTIHGNIHYGDPKGESQGTYKLPNGQSFADDFHVYTLEWEPGEMRWYIDGELFNIANNWHSKHSDNAAEFTYPAPFDQDFFLILNISVGGEWPGNPDGTTELPQQMVVDYVRVYQKDEYPIREKPEQPEEELAGREPLEDGNYIYNGCFNLDDSEADGIDGVANTDYWIFLQDSGGNAEPVVDEGGMHVKITSGGTVEHGVQLIQTPIPLEKGAKYKASFRAKAENERDIKVKIGGDAARSWADYADEDPITLSTDWNNYEFEFIMPESTDLKARYEFNMGLNDADVWLSDVRLEKIEGAPITDPSNDARPALPGGNHIYNGTFDQGKDRMGFWEFKMDSSADAVEYIGSAVDDRRFEARINSGGDHAQSVQLVQEAVNIGQGNSYQLNFDASADTARSIQVSLVSTNGNVVADHTVDLDTEAQEYSIDFNVDVVTDNNVELQFNMGGSDDNVYIDNVFLGRLLQSDGIEGNLIKNGIFDSLTNWRTESISPGEAEFKVDEKGYFNAFVKNAGNQYWNIQLFQNGIYLEKDATYELFFKAKSTIDRPILALLERDGEADGNYISYFSENALLTDTFETYSYTFTMDHDSDLATKFGFSLGADENGDIPTGEHDIYIDNVVLKKIEETEDPGTEDPGTEDPGVEDPGTEDPGTEDPGAEGPETEDPGAEGPGTEDPGAEGPGTEDPGTEDPGAESPGAKSPGTEDLGIEESSVKEPIIDGDKNGNKLPKTASPIFNWLFIGMNILLMGMVLAIFTKRKSLMIKKNQ